MLITFDFQLEESSPLPLIAPPPAKKLQQLQQLHFQRMRKSGGSGSQSGGATTDLGPLHWQRMRRAAEGTSINDLDERLKRSDGDGNLENWHWQRMRRSQENSGEDGNLENWHWQRMRRSGKSDKIGELHWQRMRRAGNSDRIGELHWQRMRRSDDGDGNLENWHWQRMRRKMSDDGGLGELHWQRMRKSDGGLGSLHWQRMRRSPGVWSLESDASLVADAASSSSSSSGDRDSKRDALTQLHYQRMRKRNFIQPEQEEEEEGGGGTEEDPCLVKILKTTPGMLLGTKKTAAFFIFCQIRSLEGAPLPANAARCSRWRDVAGLRGDAGGHEAATLPEDEEGRRGPSKQTQSIYMIVRVINAVFTPA